LEEREVRGYLSERISNDGRGKGGFKTLFSVLQQRATSSIAWLPNTEGSVHGENRVGKGIHLSALIYKKGRKKESKKQVIKTKKTVLTMGSTIVKRFEFTYEMSWKAIKRYLDYTGIGCTVPRNCFREAFAQGLIDREDIWIDMIEQRNLASHIYDEDEIKEILGKIVAYKNAFQDLRLSLEGTMASPICPDSF